MATERCEVLSPLIGLSEKTLCEAPVFGTWTAKNILTHIASWDALYTERIELNLRGRTSDIESVDLDSRNARGHEERKARTLVQSLATFVDARKAFLDTLARVPDDELSRTGRLPWRSRGTFMSWSRWRYQHDATHADDLRRWRKRLGWTEGAGPKCILMEYTRSARKSLLATVAIIPEDERATLALGPRLDLGHLLSTIADSESEALAALSKPDGKPSEEEDGDQTEIGGMRGADAWAQEWRRLHATHQELLRRLQTLPETALSLGQTRTATTLYQILRACADTDRRAARRLRRHLGLRVSMR